MNYLLLRWGYKYLKKHEFNSYSKEIIQKLKENHSKLKSIMFRKKIKKALLS
jgi:hypothetical protein